MPSAADPIGSSHSAADISRQRFEISHDDQRIVSRNCCSAREPFMVKSVRRLGRDESCSDQRLHRPKPELVFITLDDLASITELRKNGLRFRAPPTERTRDIGRRNFVRSGHYRQYQLA